MYTIYDNRAGGYMYRVRYMYRTGSVGTMYGRGYRAGSVVRC